MDGSFGCDRSVIYWFLCSVLVLIYFRLVQCTSVVHMVSLLVVVLLLQLVF